MCRRFAVDLDWGEVSDWFGVGEDGTDARELPGVSYGVVPGQVIGVVAQDGRGYRRLAGARWSLVPRWSGSDVLPYPTYNARVESAAVKPTFAESMRSMRCVVPASGYFEWHGHRPFYFHAGDGGPLWMAGLYSWWRASVSSPWVLTATVVTCGAVGGPASVHDRMPLLVSPSVCDAWLDPSVDGSGLLGLVRDRGVALSCGLSFYEVAPFVDDVIDRRCIRPVGREKPLTLF
ncbi:SOS response-associated peptidase [Bifidobacterium tissieri]|uniref:SOS response-associated peptidase n=1 Tax=Bifidobacterium tissieri TaxID=1630162 RepID=UPI00123B3E07|nr:SOS response-associated peptidase [Bifidobacterium tissieri]KAA8831753.1 SOS response-associated peptidase [Bifidobacterium tissieri]